MKSCGVIFDMDGTLFDTESVFQEEWNRIAEERGLSLPESFKYEICGTSGDPMNRIIEQYYHVEEGSEIQRLCKERVARRLLAKVPEKPGCREILSFFRKRGYVIAMGSSSPMKQIRANLEITGLSSFFDALASGEEVKQESRRRIFSSWPLKSWGFPRTGAMCLRTAPTVSVLPLPPV